MDIEKTREILNDYESSGAEIKATIDDLSRLVEIILDSYLDSEG